MVPEVVGSIPIVRPNQFPLERGVFNSNSNDISIINMSELIVSKFGGTSNSTVETLQASLELAQDSQVVVASAPGVLNDEQIANFPIDTDAPEDLLKNKVTDLLLEAHTEYVSHGEVPRQQTDAIQARYTSIVANLGSRWFYKHWTDSIPPRIRQAVMHGKEATSMLGEQLQAEVYQSLGYIILDPSRSGRDLDRNHKSWGEWLRPQIDADNKYIIGGNVSFDGERMYSFGRGGSDTTAALVARGIGADYCDIYSDTPLRSAHPDIVDPSLSKILDQVPYDVGRELGLNGTGLVHADALAIMQGSGIPIRAKNTFNPNGQYTTYADIIEEPQAGEVMAVSLIDEVSFLSIHEPGMRESQGRVADISQALADAKINLVDIVGDGADRDIVIVEGDSEAEVAIEVIRAHLKDGGSVTNRQLALLTLAGYRLRPASLDLQNKLLADNVFGSNQNAPYALTGEHSLRFGIDRADAITVAKRAHNSTVTI